ncbi:hypothetical protein KCU96_g51, partial [Aureobasidium melanogenum]
LDLNNILDLASCVTKRYPLRTLSVADLVPHNVVLRVIAVLRRVSAVEVPPQVEVRPLIAYGMNLSSPCFLALGCVMITDGREDFGASKLSMHITQVIRVFQISPRRDDRSGQYVLMEL